jgi:hypothetical protein
MSKKLAAVIGVVFVLVGVLGFIPNPIVGTEGFFVTNTAHDLVHLISGLLFLGAGGIVVALAVTKPSGVPLFMKIFGAVYLLIAVLGFAVLSGAGDTGSLLGFIEINAADNWLHVVLGLGILGAGFIPATGGSSSQPHQEHQEQAAM